MQVFFTAQRNSQDTVKPDKMIDMRVGDEGVADFEKLFGAEGQGISQIKKDCPVFKKKRDV
jgi:hypothetical protein